LLSSAKQEAKLEISLEVKNQQTNKNIIYLENEKAFT